MKYSISLFLILFQVGIAGQNQFIEKLQKEISETQGPDQVDKYLQLAQAY
ncbi:MAG: hypothetical protein SH818_15105 [Saprospiraceae bacterium]|nr:hypothetical protein [Saprospiraceae bacterium]